MGSAWRTTSDGRLRVTDSVSRSQWHAILAGDPHGLVYQSPDWVQMLTARGYQDGTRLYEARDGRLLLLPMATRTLPGGVLSLRGSMPPGWGSGGVVSTGPVEPEDLTSICGDLRRDRRVLRTFIQPSPLRSAAWGAARLPGVTRIPRLAHVLDLSGGFDAVWSKRFTGAARTAVRRAERSGVVVEHDRTGELLPVFYSLLEQSVVRWAQQQHEPLALARWRARRRDPLEKFQAIVSAVPSAYHLYVARHGGRAVAAVLVYHGAGGVMYSRGAMDRELAGPVRANHLLHRVAIEDACAAGLRSYDFGESGGSAALAQFKTRFGARPAPYDELVVERLPLTAADRLARTAVKRVIGFRDTGRPDETERVPS
jgi:hypothetical protein